MKKTKPARQMLSVNDLAAMFGIGYSTAYRLMQTLKCVDLAPPGSRYRTLRVRPEEVERYLRQREVRG